MMRKIKVDIPTWNEEVDKAAAEAIAELDSACFVCDGMGMLFERVIPEPPSPSWEMEYDYRQQVDRVHYAWQRERDEFSDGESELKLQLEIAVAHEVVRLLQAKLTKFRAVKKRGR